MSRRGCDPSVSVGLVYEGRKIFSRKFDWSEQTLAMQVGLIE